MRNGQPRCFQQVSEQRPVRLVTARPLGCADEVELAAEAVAPTRCVVDVGDQGELVIPREGIEGRQSVGMSSIEEKPSK